MELGQLLARGASNILKCRKAEQEREKRGFWEPKIQAAQQMEAALQNLGVQEAHLSPHTNQGNSIVLDDAIRLHNRDIQLPREIHVCPDLAKFNNSGSGGLYGPGRDLIAVDGNYQEQIRKPRDLSQVIPNNSFIRKLPILDSLPLRKHVANSVLYHEVGHRHFFSYNGKKCFIC